MSLISFFNSIFRKKNITFNLADGERADLPPLTLKEIRNRTKDGMIVRKFLTPEQCKILVDQLRERNPNFHSDKHPIFPQSFGQIDRNSQDFEAEMMAYFQQSAAFTENFKSDFQFDILSEITRFIESQNPGSQLKIIPGFEDAGNYIPGTFRIQQPEKVNINLHCGNQFIHLFPKYYQHMSKTVEVMDQISYFIMLQEPDEGGRLILYDITWNEAQECNSAENSIQTLKGKTIHLDSSAIIGNTKIYIGLGDLLIFSGGQIWHAVEQVKGKTNRITFGGFFGFGKQYAPNDLYWWS